MNDRVKYWKDRRYTAWYDPEYQLSDAYAEHAQIDKKLLKYIEEIRNSIHAQGMQNPLQVTIKNGKATIHPGKCRAAALKALGRTHAPALVVNYDRVVDKHAIPEGCVFFDSLEDVQSYFTGDCVVEMSYRWLTVKKKK